MRFTQQMFENFLGQSFKTLPALEANLLTLSPLCRDDAAAALSMSRTGRSPVSQEQGLAVCCQIEAVNYVETAACYDDVGSGGVREAFELCALAAMKHASRAPPPLPSASASQQPDPISRYADMQSDGIS